MGHRGARDMAPENTMKSFEFLIQSGITCMEFDIHEIRDGKFVVHHDATLERTTNGTGAIANYEWSELSKFQTKDGQNLPLLNDILDLVKNTEVELQIELKNAGNWNNLKKILETTKNFERFTVISFNHRWLKELKSIFPHINTTPLMYALPVDPCAIIKSINAKGISLSVELIDKELVDECHKENFLVTAWNANNHETFTRLKSYGVDYLGTDVPYTAKTW
jgi:glycerophosphoryl diester phosphodiesterase